MSWRRFFRRGPADAELNQEIQHYLAEEADENVAKGIPPEAARRQAYLKLGNPTRVREATWRSNSIAPLESLLRNVRYAWRTLRRNPGYAVLAVLTLSLGIGANTAIFTVINGVLLRPLPYANAGQIVHLDLTAAKLGPDALGLSVQEVKDYRERNHVFSSLAEYHSMTFTLLGAKDPERVMTGVVSANYFDVLGVKPVLGRLLIPADESVTAPPVLVLSYAYWMREFGGDRNIVGRTFEMNDRVHTVIGVLPSLPEFPDPDDVYMPTTSCPFRSAPTMIADRDQRMLTAFARLKPGVSLAQANTDLAAVSRAANLLRPPRSLRPRSSPGLRQSRQHRAIAADATLARAGDSHGHRSQPVEPVQPTAHRKHDDRSGRRHRRHWPRCNRLKITD